MLIYPYFIIYCGIWLFKNANLIEYPSYRNLFRKIRRIAAVSFWFTIATLLFIHCLYFGHILFAESVSLTKFHLLFLRNSVNIENKPKSIGILRVLYDDYLRCNSRFSISRERVGAIVHDTLVIIADTIIGDSAIVILVEVMLLTCISSLKFYSYIILLIHKSIHSKNISVDIVLVRMNSV